MVSPAGCVSIRLTQNTTWIHTINPEAVLGSQEAHNSGNINRISHTAERSDVRERILHLLGTHVLVPAGHIAPCSMSEHVRLDTSGSDGIDAHLLAAHISRQGADESLDGVLATSIQRVVGWATRCGGDGRHQDDGATDLTVLVGLLGDEELRAGVRVEHLVVALWRDFEEGGKVLSAGVGHDDINLAERLLALLEELDNLGDLANVGFDSDSVAAGGLDLLNDFLGRGLAGAVVDDDLGATLCEFDGNATTDTTTGTGHEGDFAVEAGGRWHVLSGHGVCFAFVV